MTISARQYRRLIDEIGTTNYRMAQMLEMSQRTAGRYARKETERIPEAINIVFRLMLKYKLTPDDIDELKEEKLL